MHEFSLCSSLVDSLLAEYEKLPEPRPILRKAHLVVGKLRQIVPEFMQSAYELLVEDTPAAGSTLVIHERNIEVSCQACSWNGTLVERIFLCPECDSPKLHIQQGKELYLESLEVEDKENYSSS